MINADPQRTMSFTMFSQPDFYFQTFSPCPSPSQGCLNDAFAWIHGDYSNDIGQTWLGLAGPGVENERHRRPRPGPTTRTSSRR